MQLHQFLSGGVFVACIAVALLFLRINRKSPDRLFVYLAIAFALLAVERVLLAVVSANTELPPVADGGNYEYAPFVYVVRLVAYIFIIVAIVDKNRQK